MLHITFLVGEEADTPCLTNFLVITAYAFSSSPVDVYVRQDVSSTEAKRLPAIFSAISFDVTHYLSLYITRGLPLNPVEAGIPLAELRLKVPRCEYRVFSSRD